MKIYRIKAIIETSIYHEAILIVQKQFPNTPCCLGSGHSMDILVIVQKSSESNLIKCR